MEAKSGAEVRRLHIVYFLSRKGGVEHPHLIRVSHLCRNGVRLRDIKRWLRELRGDDLPESYSWSFKRRYRTGYVWQDIQDDDLVTPISDNEYVLKGSEIASTKNTTGVSIGKKQPCLDEGQKATPEYQDQSLIPRHISMKSSPQIEEEYPVFGSEASTLTDNSLTLETQKNDINDRDGIKHEKLDKKTSYDGKIDNPKKRNNKVEIDEKITKHAASSNAASVPHKFSKSKSCSSYATSSNVFRNMMSCGAINTDDSATVTISKNHIPFSSLCSTDQKTVHSAETLKGDRTIGVPHRIYTIPWMDRQWSSRNGGMKDAMEDKEESKVQTRASAGAYKPINGPNCSQCGKPFKPEKLHAHMKFCKGMKALSRSASVSISKDPFGKEQLYLDEGQKAISEYRDQNLISRHILTKPSSDVEEYPVFGSETSSLIDDSLNLETHKSIINDTDGIKQEIPDEEPSSKGKVNSPNKRNDKVKIDEKITKQAAASNAASVQHNFSKSKSCSSCGSSRNMFRNMLSCHAINTDDSATVTISKNHGPFFNICSTDQRIIHSAETRIGNRKIGAPHRIDNTPWHQQQWGGRDSRNDGMKDSTEAKKIPASAAAYKPIYDPKCSQCGKPFKPEKLHAHMKSCKGMKALFKNASFAKKTEQKSPSERIAWYCDMSWAEKPTKRVLPPPAQEYNPIPFIKDACTKCFNARDLIREDLLCHFGFSRKGVAVEGDLAERIMKSYLLEAYKKHESEASRGSIPRTEERANSTSKEPVNLSLEEPVNPPPAEPTKEKRRKSSSGGDKHPKKKKTSSSAEVNTEAGASQPDVEVSSFIAQPVTSTIVAFFHHFIPPLDAPVVNSASDKKVTEALTSNFLQALIWGGELSRRVTKAREVANSSKRSLNDVMAKHDKLMKEIEDVRGAFDAEKKSLEQKLTSSEASVIRLQEEMKKAGEEAEEKIKRAQEEAEASWEKRKADFLKDNGYSEAEHPFSFLDVLKSLEALPDDGEAEPSGAKK
ncbi:protein UPSTREAM OF FLC-like [Dorcoceras hygrometricum]|uniref:Protein UPSTREAM OF FLC-like n=1 Tax=Dorcoceras hygrometricum TaxID=472368 RepID=A0A2Z7A9Q7_9LAMI|nr:protein UPSTREAM OF FLC-like [Dorcoceras hygrometricum]